MQVAVREHMQERRQGLGLVHAFHLNDSKKPLGSRVDLVDFVIEHYREYVTAALEGRPHLFLMA